ncbi:MAG: hypothetical protein WCQ16_01160 [Verrucomicrobiae bacterium]
MKPQPTIMALWVFLLTGICGTTLGLAQNGTSPVTYESISAGKNAELQKFLNRKKALELQPAGAQRDLQVKQEVQRHLAENKKLSVQEQSLRRETVTDLKQKWNKVDADWKNECARHEATRKELEKLPEGPERTAKIEAETASHRTNSKQIAVDRNTVHEGVMQQANREVTGGSKGVSNEIKQTAGTKVNDPNHRGMNGDCDAGGGYRTTEKVEKILNEMGVKNTAGEPVKIKNGVLETSGEFGMTVNADPGLDRVGSSGHQAQVKQAAAHGETYVSEQAGAVQSPSLKDHLATLDHTKKAAHGLNENPESLVGQSPEAQAMAKGAVKAAAQADLPPETLDAIARRNGLKNSESMLDKMAEIKTGNASIANTEEAAKLQQATRDILNASEAGTKARANAEVEQMKTKIADLEANGNTTEAHRLREEVADYNAKANESNKALAETNKSSTGAGKETAPESPRVETPEKPGAAGRKSGTSSATEPAATTKNPGPAEVVGEPVTKTGGVPRNEPEGKPVAGGSKLVQGAGLLLGAYGIYEGYKTASAEMEAKKQGEPQGLTGWSANKAELAGRTLWHGLGFGAMAEIGQQAGRDSFDQYKKDIADGKVSPDSWASYGWMKTRGVLGGLFGGVKAVTYDAAKSSGTALGEATGESVGIGKDVYGWMKSVQNENQTAEWRSKKIYDTLIKNGASTVGAQMAADGVLQGDFTEAKRLTKILEGKQAAKLAAAQKTADNDAAKSAADPSKGKPDLVAGKDDGKTKPEDKGNLKGELAKLAADPSKTKPDPAKALTGKEDGKTKPDEKSKASLKGDQTKLAADTSKDEEARLKAAMEDKAKAIALLRESIAKTRNAIAQLKAIAGENAPTGDLEAILATMNARYRELTGGSLKTTAKGTNGKPSATPATPLEGGKVTNADGSSTVLTYGKDASGNKVPITTDYDSKGRVLHRTTVDSTGKTVPVR